MMWTPSVIVVRVLRKEARDIRLWLPVFTLWPLVLIFLLIAMPIAVFFTGYERVRQAFVALPAVLQTVCCLRGTRVEVRDPGKGENVEIAIY